MVTTAVAIAIFELLATRREGARKVVKLRWSMGSNYEAAGHGMRGELDRGVVETPERVPTGRERERAEFGRYMGAER